MKLFWYRETLSISESVLFERYDTLNTPPCTRPLQVAENIKATSFYVTVKSLVDFTHKSVHPLISYLILKLPNFYGENAPDHAYGEQKVHNNI